MTDREKRTWRANVARDLCKQVYGAVDAWMESRTPLDNESVRVGNQLVRKFKAAIRKVR